MTSTAKLKIKEQTLTLVFNREELAQRRKKNECVISFRLNEPIQHEGKNCPFVVFPIQITSELNLEQTGEGILCADEAEANRIRNSIALYRQETPHIVLASWQGGFALGALSDVQHFKRCLELFQFHVPKFFEGQSCGFAIRLYDVYTNKTRVLIWEKLLPVTDKDEAEKLLREKESELRIKQIEKDKIQVTQQIEPSLIQSQIKVLSKSYPETIAFFTKPETATIEAIFKAYQCETLALYGTLIGTLGKTEFQKAAKGLLNASRRKNPARDAVSFELVVGWRLRGYDRMTPKTRFEALKQLGFEVSTSEAIRKICERLKLPVVRKRGAPRKLNSRK